MHNSTGEVIAALDMAALSYMSWPASDYEEAMKKHIEEARSTPHRSRPLTCSAVFGKAIPQFVTNLRALEQLTYLGAYAASRDNALAEMCADDL